MAEPYWASDDGDVMLYLGDNLDVLRTLEADSIDAIVTDPPAGITFMDREWDDFRRARNLADAGRDNVFGRTSARGPEYGRRDRGQFVDWLTERMSEALRVLKPGGHLLVWSIPRTSHWTAWALEDAGLEIRDCILHLFGSGFPKSLDVSKAIDKRPGVARHAEFAAHLASMREAAGLSRQDVAEKVVGTRSGACWNWEHHQWPEARWWPALRDLLSLDGKWGAVIAEAEREVTGRNSNHRSRPDSPSAYTVQQGRDGDVTAPATEDAARWAGFGTALKPGQELWWLARKPLKGTVAACVLEFGTGALNIAGCRIATPDGLGRTRNTALGVMNDGDPLGRWPANVVFTHSAACDGVCAPDCPVGELDRQSGTLHTHGGGTRTGVRTSNGWGMGEQPEVVPSFGGTSGGASRFYPVFRYQAKAPASERPRLEDGTAHETVKPLGLMAWLVRLITPPGGTVLDLFAGSGPVGEACIIEGFRCVLVEQDPKSAELIVRRLSKPIQPAMFGLDDGVVA